VNRASIDIGSNSLLLLIIDEEGRVLHDEVRVVGLGKGLGDRGLFRPDRMADAQAVLADFAATATRYGVHPTAVHAVATSAARRALNAGTFFERVREQTGLGVRVVEGVEEAQLTWLGALGGLQLAEGPVAVIDLGGGSTEVVLGEGDHIGMRSSLELGTVRLTERFFGTTIDRYRPEKLAQLRQLVSDQVATLQWPVLPRSLVAVAGTATSLAAMELRLTTYDRAKVHGFRLTRAALRRHIDALLGAGPEERRQMSAVSPERADFLLAGACVIEAIVTAVHKDSVRVSDGGVRHGLLTEAALNAVR
jgi:exopolyphosphatase/guanosine-5'-triphosphate,3'-diphosphate pyrophosphatase